MSQHIVSREDCLALLKKSFDGYDIDGNGFITYEEVKEAWRVSFSGRKQHSLGEIDQQAKVQTMEFHVDVGAMIC